MGIVRGAVGRASFAGNTVRCTVVGTIEGPVPGSDRGAVTGAVGGAVVVGAVGGAVGVVFLRIMTVPGATSPRLSASLWVIRILLV